MGVANVACAGAENDRAELYLTLGDARLFLGEFQFDKCPAALGGESPSIVLKVGHYSGPGPSSFTGRELVIPLKGSGKFLDEEESESARNGATGHLNGHMTSSSAGVEVTPEMIEAGHDAIARRWVEFVEEPSELAAVLEAAFLAMWRAR